MGTITERPTVRLVERRLHRARLHSKRRGVAGALALGLVGMLVVAPAVGAAAPVKRKPPVDLPGTVDDKGTAKIKGTNVTITQGDSFFKKTFLKAKAGTTVTVAIKNEGQAQHTFTIDDPAGGAAPIADEHLSPGDTTTVDVTVPADGSAFVFYCRFHVGSGMQGAIFSKAGKKVSESDRKKASTGGGRYEPSSGGSGY